MVLVTYDGYDYVTFTYIHMYTKVLNCTHALSILVYLAGFGICWPDWKHYKVMNDLGSLISTLVTFFLSHRNCSNIVAAQPA